MAEGSCTTDSEQLRSLLPKNAVDSAYVVGLKTTKFRDLDYTDMRSRNDDSVVKRTSCCESGFLRKKKASDTEEWQEFDRNDKVVRSGDGVVAGKLFEEELSRASQKNR